jgi:imidazolonepropionase-like amidohydrolase
MGYFRELEAAIETMKALRRRDVRILPGGDYGFAWTPHGTNAKDLEYFVKYVGMSTMEALLSATAWGAAMMRMGPDQLGKIRDGYLADLLLVDGDPLADITVLQDKRRILAVMKDGEFHRAPETRSSARPATRWAA